MKFQESYLYKEEDENSIQIPMNSITELNIKNGLEQSMPATLIALGFSIPQNIRIEKEKMLNLLEKINYWEDDVAHDAVFDL